MKTSRMQTTKQNKQTNPRIPKPEIRDDLDSRKMKSRIPGEMTSHTIKKKPGAKSPEAKTSN